MERFHVLGSKNNSKIVREMSAVGFLTLECESETNLSIGSVFQIFDEENTTETTTTTLTSSATTTTSSSSTSHDPRIGDPNFFTVEGLAQVLNTKLIPKYEKFTFVPNKRKRQWRASSPPSIPGDETQPGSNAQSEGQTSNHNSPPEAFNVKAHIHTLSVPVPRDENGYPTVDPKETLCYQLGKIVSRELNQNLPPWEVYLIKDWVRPALFWRIHHCIGDGQSIATALLASSDTDINEVLRKLPSPPRPSFFMQVYFYLWVFFGSFLVVLRWIYLEFFFPRPPSIFSGSLVSKEKLVAFDCETMEVERALRVAKHYKATFNDLMLSCMAGAIGRMLKEQHMDPVEFPISMPVNLRPTPFPDDVSNVIGSYSLYLPTWQTNARKRLRIVSRRMAVVKRLPEQYLTYGLSLFCAMLPASISTRFFKLLASHLGAVITNVRGPREVFGYQGNKVWGLIGFVPPPVGVRLGFGVASYAGRVMLSVSADSKLTPDLPQLITYFIKEFVDCEQSVDEEDREEKSQ